MHNEARRYATISPPLLRAHTGTKGDGGGGRGRYVSIHISTELLDGSVTQAKFYASFNIYSSSSIFYKVSQVGNFSATVPFLM